MLRRRPRHDEWYPYQQPRRIHAGYAGERRAAILHDHPIKQGSSVSRTFKLMQNDSCFAQQWTLIVSGISAMLILLEGFNIVTASVALVFLVAGLLSCYFLSSKHSIHTSRIVFAIEFAFLLAVLTSKTCARVAGRSVDIAAVKFLLAPASARAGVFGDMLSFKQVVLGLVRELFKSIAILTLAGLFTVIASSCDTKKSTRTNQYLCKATAVAALLIASASCKAFIFDATKAGHLRGGRCETSFDYPPPTKLKKTPSILVLSIDSLRADMFTDETFPLSRNELLREVDGVSSSEWFSHDAGSSLSDQGIATLFYSMQSPSRSHFLSYMNNLKIRSWPFQTLRDNGYSIHRIRTLDDEDFCFGFMEHCDLTTRDFDTVMKDYGDENATLRHTLPVALRWITERMGPGGNPSTPFLLNVDVQDVRFPYKRTHHAWNEHKNTSFLEPEMTEDELYKVKKISGELDGFVSAHLRPGLVNRVKNAVLALDGIFFEFLKAIRPFREDLIMIITSDHGELLLESDGRHPAISHSNHDTSDLQRRVPFVITGPTPIVKSLEMPRNVPTMHSSVFPSLFEALGAQLEGAWKRETNYFSYHNYKTTDHEGFVFYQELWSEDTVLRVGNKRVRLGEGSVVIEAKNVETMDELDGHDIQAIIDLAPKPYELTWPGTTNYCSREKEKAARSSNVNEQIDDEPQVDDSSGSSLNRNVSFVASKERIHSSRVPTVQSLAAKKSFHSGKSLDVVSIGSLTRSEYLSVQQSTWGQHVMLRNFWGFTEKDDFNTTCSSMSSEEALAVTQYCKKYRGWKAEPRQFAAFGYANSEGTHHESHPGWVCAQRRIGSALGWIQHVYTDGGIHPPDLLIIMDDDTYIDLVRLEEYFKSIDPSRLQVHAACIFAKSGYVRWAFPYGGFGTLMTRASVQQMLRPIYCNATTRQLDPHGAIVCDSIAYNMIGERALFEEGMSTAELFRDYTAQKTFCLHSDWVTGYMTNYYSLSKMSFTASGDEMIMDALYSMAAWPEQCGNVTTKCGTHSITCHRIGVRTMEALSLASYRRSPESYNQMPALPAALANYSQIQHLPEYRVRTREQMSASVGVLKTQWTPLRPLALASNNSTILLASFLFADVLLVEESVMLQLFVESAQYSGVDVLIVGWPKPPFTLPENIRHLPITWDQLVDLVCVKLFDGRDLPELRAASAYKINDFKPLFGFLFEELLPQYGWWGHVDNDLLLGDVRSFLPESALEHLDVISPLGGNRKEKEREMTWGPFTMYRNTDTLNQLFRFAPDNLMDIFGIGHTWAFDEWGQGGRFDSSMTGIVLARSEELGLRLSDMYIPFENDVECTLVKRGARSEIMAKGPCRAEGSSKDSTCLQEVILCHYQFGKLEIARTIWDETTRSKVLAADLLRVSAAEGVHVLSKENFASIPWVERLRNDTIIHSQKATLNRPDPRQWVTSREVLPGSFENEELAVVFDMLQNAKISSVVFASGGTQFKLLLGLEGGLTAIFKPERYHRGWDRPNAEVAAFHLSRLLDMRRAPVAVGRRIHVAKELLPAASSGFRVAFVKHRDTPNCIKGTCRWCGPPVCPQPDGKIEGVMILMLPNETSTGSSLSLHSVNSSLFDQPKYSNKARQRVKNSTSRLLDIAEASIFDFLIQNIDRHHYEYIDNEEGDGAVLLIDQGKGFPPDYKETMRLLAPLSVLSMLRNQTLQHLQWISKWNISLSDALERLTSVDISTPYGATGKGVLSGADLFSLDRRFDIVVKRLQEVKKVV